MRVVWALTSSPGPTLTRLVPPDGYSTHCETARITSSTPDKVRRYRLRLEATAEIILPGEGQPVVPGDPDDDVIVYTAVAGAAKVLCTRDLHFRQPDVLQHCQRRGIRILSDPELLGELGLG